jgi:hypothetical protein
MFDIQELYAALQDPNSPMRAKLLDNLAMSPLDPAAAMQQMQQVSPDIMRGGLPPEPKEAPPNMSNLMEPGSNMPAPPQPIQRGELGMGGKGPWSFDYGAEGNPNFIPPAMGGSPANGGVSIMPGEGSGEKTEEQKAADIKKMLEGAAGFKSNNDEAKKLAPPGGSAPSNNWRGFTAAYYNTPNLNRQASLAEILNGRAS